MTDVSSAAVLVAPKQFEIQQFPLPTISENDGLLRVEASGICGADLPVYDGTNATLRGEEFYEYPIILGHEIVGRIEKIGAGATRRWGVAEGDRIILERWVPCGHCNACFSGDYRLCVQRVDGAPMVYGGSPTRLAPSLWGGYSEYLYLHPDAVVYKVSDAIPAQSVPLFTPLGNMVSWLQAVGGLSVGSSVVIQGAGPEGLSGVVVAAAAGASDIIVTGLNADHARLELARRLGATCTINVQAEDALDIVRGCTAGEMVDIVVDATGGDPQQPFDVGLSMLKSGGRFINGAFHEGRRAHLDVDLIMGKALSIHGVVGRDRRSLLGALRLMESGRFPLDLLTAPPVPLDGVAEAFRQIGDPVNAPAGLISVMPHGLG